MSPYTKTTWVANVTPVTAVAMNNLESGIASLSAPAPSTTPPASPADGDIWYLPANPTAGFIWQLRYNAGSASAYKWEYVGGTPMMARDDSTRNTVASTWTWATGGITLPRSGDYLIHSHVTSVSFPAPGQFGQGPGLSADGSPSNYSFTNNAQATPDGVSYVASLQLNMAAAGLIGTWIYGSIANIAASRIWLFVQPVRVS